MYNHYVREGALVVGGKAYRIFPDPDNESVGQAALEHPDRFLFFAFINPRGPRDFVEVLNRCRERFPLRGVKAHAWFHDLNPSEDLLPVGEMCQAWDIPLLIHLGGNGRTGNIGGLVKACPRLKVILAHAGLPYLGRIWPFVRRHPSLFMDVSGPYLNANIVKKAVRAVGSGKLLFGTDAPYSLRTDQGHSFTAMKDWTARLPISDQEK